MNKLTKKLSILFASFAMAMGVGLVGGTKSANADSGSVTYTIASKTSVTETGTAPSGSSATYTQTYSTAGQMTSNNSTTLTLSGYSGYKITGIVLSMKSNASKGAGTFSATAGSETLASIASATTFNKWFDNTSYGGTYRDVTVTMSNAAYEIKTGETVTILIKGTTNSIYIQSYKISWESATSTPAANLTGVTVTPPTKLTGYKEGDTLETAGFKVEEKYDDDSTVDITDDTSKYSVSPALTTALSAGDNTFTVTYTADESIAVTGGTFTATATARTLVSIAVKTMPNKTTYYIGDSFDATGLTLTATYADGDTLEITSGFTISGFDSSAVGTSTITVTYNGFETTFDVTIEEAPLVGSVTISMADESQITSKGTSTTIWENSPVTFTVNKGTASTNVGNGSYYSNPLRVYKNQEVVIDAGVNTITSVTINLNNTAAGLSGTWTGGTASQSSKVVTITADSGVTKLSTTVTATTQVSSVVVEYQVTKMAVTGVELSASELVFDNRTSDAQTLTATVLPTGATNKNVTWSVIGDAVTVNEGVVTPVKAGTATVIVTTEDGGFTASCSVTVKKDLSVTINPSITDTQLKVGQTVQLNYELSGLDKDTVTSPTVTWETVSGNENVLSVSTSGLVTAMGVGTDSIKVTIDNEVSATIEYEVLNDIVAVESVKISIPDGASTTLKTGATLQLTATVNPSDATNQEVAWSTTDEEIASVSTTGLVTAGTKSGTATITVVSDADTAIKDTIEITVNNSVEGVTLDYNELSLNTNSTAKLVATVSPEYATNKNVTWSSNMPTVADVDQEGNITTKNKAGVAIITVTTVDGSYSASCTVTVTKAPVIAGGVYTGTTAVDGAEKLTVSSGYASTYNSDNWVLTFGGNSKSGGSNSNNASKCRLPGYYDGTEVTASDYAWALATKSTLSDVSKITFAYDGGSGTTNGKAYLTYSTDGSTYSLVPLTTGTQGMSVGTAGTYTFEFDSISSAYYAVIIKNTSTSGNFRFDNLSVLTYSIPLDDNEAFVNAVNAIGDVTIDSGAAIEKAKSLYANLTEEDLALESVIAAKETLDAKEAEYNALVADKAVADEVVSKIDAIGEVTKDNYESKITAIEEAEAAYAKLTDSQKSFVTNYSTLTAARDAYDEFSSAKDKASEVIDLIDAIGDVTMDNFSDKITAIEKAETAYAGLTDLQKEFVTNYSTLTSARESYDSYSQVQDVIDDINAIGEITKDNYISKGEDIKNIQSAYDALTDSQKELVTNYDVLKAASDRYDALVAAKSNADALIDLINEYDVDTITYDDKGHIEALRELYEEHKDTDVGLFITDEDVAKIEALEARMTKLTNAHDFVAEWSQLRTKGGETGICGYLTDSENSDLAALLNKFAAFDAETQKLIRAETDVVYGETTVTIGETMDYMASVRDWVKNIVNPTSSELNGIVLTTNTESNSLVALFAIVGLVAVSAYYFLEKKKLSK